MRIGNYAAKTFGCLAVIFVSAAAVIGIFLGPCALSGHGFTVGVGGSELFAQVLDAKFAPHPSEVVGDHRVVPVELTAAAAVFKILEPSRHSATARSGSNGLSLIHI